MAMEFSAAHATIGGINSYNLVSRTNIQQNLTSKTNPLDEGMSYLDPNLVVIENKSLGERGLNLNFLKDKLFNAAFWEATKDGVTKELIPKILGITINSNSVLGLFAVATLEGLYKYTIDNVSKSDSNNLYLGDGAVFFSGFSKSVSSNMTKTYLKSLKLQDFLDLESFKKWEGMVKNKLGEGGLEKVLEKTGLSGLKNAEPQLWKSISMFRFTNVVGNMGLGIGIDYIASLAANIFTASIKGEKLTLENVKPGSTLLKSSTKMIFAAAGHLVGGKTGQVVGTVIGAYIGEIQVKMFDSNEGWCAIAGGAQIVGAVAGIAAVVFLASNPAGWCIALGALAGAAIGFVATYVGYLFSGDNLKVSMNTGAEVVAT